MKYRVLSNYIAARNEQIKLEDHLHSYDLSNSIIPAIQGHILVQLMANMFIKVSDRQLLYQTVLSCNRVKRTYTKACNHVDNWTQAKDIPDQIQKIEEIGLGICKSKHLTTEEFA